MVAIYNTSLLIASMTLLASFVNAYGQIAQVVDANNFCVFLPPNDSADRNIADTEWNAQAFCLGNAPLAKNAGKLNSGFIQSAHFLETDKYIQVTGQINPSKAKLNVTDEGGQMDIKAPKGSSCAGWKYYVNLIEPAGKTFCMRCCNDDRTCNRGISEKGCAHIIPGDYSGPYGNGPSSDVDSDSPATTKSTTKTTKTKTKVKTTTTTTTTTTHEPTTTTTTTNEPTTTTTTTNEPIAATVAPAAGTTTISISNTTPSANEKSGTSDGDNSISNKKNEMLSQNNDVTEQSVSAAYQFQPSIITLMIALITIALMTAQ